MASCRIRRVRKKLGRPAQHLVGSVGAAHRRCAFGPAAPPGPACAGSGSASGTGTGPSHFGSPSAGTDEHQFLTISPLVSTPERPIPSADGLKMKKLKKSLPLPSGPSSHAITVNGTRSGPSRPMASNSTPWLGTLHTFELVRYSLIKVAGSLDASAKTVATLPSWWTSSYAVMENRPVRSACTSKSKVCTLLWGVGEPIPSCPVPLTRAPGTTHVTPKVVVPVPPAGTVTAPGFAALTVQFEATPDRATGLAPAGTVKVALPFVVAIGWLIVPSTVTV